MKQFFIAILLTLIFSSSVFAQEEITRSAGFVPGPLWFSNSKIFSGEKTRIYTAVYNSSDYDITGTIAFIDNNNTIGTKDFSLAKGVGTQDIWIDWEPDQGNHQVAVKIVNARASQIDEEMALSFSNNTNIASEKVFVDGDNDGDRIGNTEDEDDDNDGVNDKEEIEQGTDPFTVNATSTSEKFASEVQLQNPVSSIPGGKIVEKKVSSVLSEHSNEDLDNVLVKLNLFTESSLEKLENKKNEIESKLKNRKRDDSKNSSGNVVESTGRDSKDSKSVKSTTTKLLDSFKKESLLDKAKVNLSENEQKEIKNNIEGSFKAFFSRAYLLILKTLIFVLNKPFLLFFSIFLIVYMVLKGVFKFFVD